MAHSMLKLHSLFMYALAFISFFFLGILYARFVEAGKDQMLAGGAIVLGYGVVAAFIGLVLALLISYKLNKKYIVFINIALLLSIVLSLVFFTIEYKKRNKEKDSLEKTATPVTSKSIHIKNNQPKSIIC